MPTARQPLRILALPISLHHSKPLYCFHPLVSRVSNVPSDGLLNPSSASSSPSPSRQRFQLRTALPRLVNWSSHKWDELSTNESNTLKYRIWSYGENLMNKIEFEEWNLKSIDPNSLHPKPVRRKDDIDNSVPINEKKEEEVDDAVPLYYPPTIVTTPSSILQILQESLISRAPYHRRRIFICLAATPLTIPFMIIPIIPNLPFFFLVWRAWSHWRAWKSSTYLSELSERNLLVPTPCPSLDDAYSKAKTSPTLQQEKEQEHHHHHHHHHSNPTSLLLTLNGVDNIVNSFELSDRCKHDLHRTVTQSKARLEEVR